MKYIVAIIQPDRLDEVLELLEAKQVHLVTVSNVLGRGRQNASRKCIVVTKKQVPCLRK